MGYLEDILDQPENLERSRESFMTALGSVDLSAFEDGLLVMAGMGSSYFASIPAACGLREAGRQAFALSATELLDPGGSSLGAAYIGISQSGKSAETVEAFSKISAPRLSLTNTGSGPLSERVDMALPIGSAEDRAIAILTHTATLSAMAELAGALGAHLEFDWNRLSSLVAGVLKRSAPAAEEVAERFADIGCLDFVARGSSLGSAGEGALLMREVVRVPAAYTDTLQYLHGPVEVAERGRGCVLFGSGREVRLARDLASYGTAVLLITTASVEPAENLLVLSIPKLPNMLLPVLEILPMQLITHRMAQAQGLAADGFRNRQEDTKLSVE